MLTKKLISLSVVSSLALGGCSLTSETKSPETQQVSLAPSQWPAADQEKFNQIERDTFPGNPEAVGYQGAVAGSFHGLAQRAGLEALKQGGTSADAAMTTALTQVTLGAGAVVSHFGIMSVVHYDAASGEVSYMNANWNTVKGETDAMSIPGTVGFSGDALYGGVPSGRSALVGGFMKGVEAMNERYGKLPFERLFEPSIELAEEGITWTPSLNKYLKPRKKSLSRLPETKAVFSKADGSWLQEGDTFKQPALAKTLRAVAEQGADYMYSGPWAKKAVAAVQKDGGHMTLEDLANYEVIWGKPLIAEHNGYTINANGLPSYGGASMIEALHLAEAANIRELGHWSENPESFRRMSELTANMMVPHIKAGMPQVLDQMYPGMDFSPESRITAEHGEQFWQRMEAGVKLAQWDDATPKHSDTVVAIDQWGNMTAVVHSINAVVWGATGIIVDGVSIGDPAVHQKAIIASVEPGSRLPDPVEHGLLLKDGEPVMAFSSMSMGLHQQTVQSLINVMDFGMSPKQALDAPSFFLPETRVDPKTGMPNNTARVMEGEFDQALLDKTGLPVNQITPAERRMAQGLWVGIARDPKTGELRAASHPYTNGQALAY